MDSWKKTKNIYPTEEKAKEVALVIEATEGRLASSKKGPQYGVETKLEKSEEGWSILWRTVLLPPSAHGCGSGCGSCGSEQSVPLKQTAKIIAFRPRQSQE